MPVNSISGAQAFPPAEPPGKARKAQAAEPSTVSAAPPDLPPPPPPPRVRGVIRLLQEGHFQGVADVRLRINFADELAALQSQSNARVTDGGPDPIVAAADAVIADFLSQNELDQGTIEQIQTARDAFAEAVRQAFDTAEGVSPQSLVDALAVAINDFIGSIEGVIPTDTTQVLLDAASVGGGGTASDPVQSDGGTPAPTVEAALPPLGQLVGLLRDALDAILPELQKQFDSAQILPPLSPPNGNGRAYDKFVAILNGLTPQDSGSVDTAA